jgi:hypothetical protein
MQTLEAMAVEVGLGGDDSCPFCKETSDNGRTNDFSNNPTKLGSSLGDEPDWYVDVPHPMAGNMYSENRLRTNAHHLIPADASFNPHPTIKRLLDKADGDITNNVGYGVNHGKNGEWLPSYPEDYQQTQVKQVPITWGEMTDQFPSMQYRIAVIAMRKTNKQFHDAHPDYSQFVSGCLDKIVEKVNNVAGKHTCETPVQPLAKPWKPPYALCGRLDSLSGRLRALLSGSPKKWRDPIFTSRHARQFHTQSMLPPPSLPSGSS